MSQNLPAYLDILNPEQKKAVLHRGNPLLILAGAGSGKTRVITTKIAWLIEQGIDPFSILAVTFTNKAAREMENRACLMENRAKNAMLRTFHSFGAWFLRRYGELGGIKREFVIYDDDDSMALLSSIMEGQPKADIRNMRNNIARAKDYFLSPGDPELDLIDHRKSFKTIYNKYEEKMARIGNVDFGDLIKKPVEILRNEGDIAKRIRERFSVIMVDEYQDANVAQSELLKELYSPSSYLCVVGDDDQSIYRFRGAEVKNILTFPEIFPNAEIIRLERNYRSTSPILGLASSVVDNNKGRLGKKLNAEKGEGKLPVLAFLPDQDLETAYCAELIKKSTGNSWSDWAIIYRTNAQSLGFETEFLRKKIPYRVVGSLKFYEREEIKDVLALLAFLVNPRDEVAFRRMANKPGRGLGSASLSKITDKASASRSGDLIEASMEISASLSAKARAGISDFINTIEAGRNTLTGEENIKDFAYEGLKTESLKTDSLKAGIGLSSCVVMLAAKSGIAEYHANRDELSGNQRLNNIQELANAASLYKSSMDGLLEFLEHIELDRAGTDIDQENNDNNAVTLITLHNTKGLEFKKVIITGIEQGIFPREDKKGEDLEEERRLFYVGTTRAMDELYLCSCQRRRVYGRDMQMEPSVFLGEIDRKTIRIIGQPPNSFKTTAGKKNAGQNTIYPGGDGNYGSKKIQESSDGLWKLGDRVFHDDQGYGIISQIKEMDEGSQIRVIFENSHQMDFISQKQSFNFTKIRDD